MSETRISETQLEIAKTLLDHPEGMTILDLQIHVDKTNKTIWNALDRFSKIDLVEKIGIAGKPFTYKALPKLLDVITGEAEGVNFVDYRSPHQKPKPKPEKLNSETEFPDRLAAVVAALDEAGVKKKNGDEPILVEDRVSILVDERDKFSSTLTKLKSKTVDGIDPKRIKPILDAVNTPSVRLMIGREPTVEDILDKIIDAGVAELERQLGKKR